ncbi:TPA: hypothetical protein ACG63C_004639, partial [Escherichia coli]
IKLMTVGNYSIHTLSKVHQPTAARLAYGVSAVLYNPGWKPLIQSRYTNIIDDRHLLTRDF